MSNANALSYEAYVEWAASRYPEARGEVIGAMAEALQWCQTNYPEGNDECPVTLRSVSSGVVLTPSRGSQ